MRRKANREDFAAPFGRVSLWVPKRLREDAKAAAGMTRTNILGITATLADAIRARVSRTGQSADGVRRSKHLITGGMWASMTVRGRAANSASVGFTGRSLAAYWGSPRAKFYKPMMVRNHDKAWFSQQASGQGAPPFLAPSEAEKQALADAWTARFGEAFDATPHATGLGAALLRKLRTR